MMKKMVLIIMFIVCWSMVSISADNKRDLPPGNIKLLDGYKHKTEQGIDTNVGKIWKEGGITIKYDIGFLAGNYADKKEIKEYFWYKEQIVNGQNVRCALTKENILTITFPEHSANFFCKIKTQEDIADILLMVFTYQSNTSSS